MSRVWASVAKTAPIRAWVNAIRPVESRLDEEDEEGEERVRKASEGEDGKHSLEFLTRTRPETVRHLTILGGSGPEWTGIPSIWRSQWRIGALLTSLESLTVLGEVKDET